MPARDEPDLDPVLADAVRRTYVRPVDEGIASRHVSAIVAAATAAQASAPRVRRGRRVWRPALGMGAAAMLLCLPVGLAAAGVSLPAIVQEPYDAVGIDLPDQTAETSAPRRVPAPSSVTSRTPAITTTTRPPASAASGTARPKSSASPGRSGTSNGDDRPATSDRPATTPPANGNGDRNDANGNANGNGNAPSAKPPPAPRRPVTPPRKPTTVTPGSGRKPATPSVRPNLGPRQDPATPPNGKAQSNGSPKQGAGG